MPYFGGGHWVTLPKNSVHSPQLPVHASLSAIQPTHFRLAWTRNPQGWLITVDLGARLGWSSPNQHPILPYSLAKWRLVEMIIIGRLLWGLTSGLSWLKCTALGKYSCCMCTCIGNSKINQNFFSKKEFS